MPWLRPHRRPGLRLVLLLALLPLATLPWLGMRFVETVAGLARDVQLDNLEAAARGVAASLDGRSDLFDPADGLRLPPGVAAVAATPVATLPAAREGGGWQDGDAWPWRTLTVERMTEAPVETLEVRAVVLRDAAGRRRLLVRARDERLVPPGDLDADPGGGPIIAAGDALTVTVGAPVDWARLPEVEQERRYPVALEADPPGGWRAQLDLPDDARLVRLQVADVDYLGTRRVEARADSGWWLLADRDPPLALAALAETRRTNLLRAFEQASGTVRIHGADARILAERGTPPRTLPPPQGWSAQLARLVIGFAGASRGEVAATAAGEADARRAALAGALAGIGTRASVPIAAAGGLPVWLIAAAQPIRVDGRVAGALVLEDTTLSRAATGLATIETLSGLVLAAFAASVLAVLAVATLTVRRLGRLRRAAEEAIDARGRVVGTIPAFRWQDEIGRLAASHAHVLERLREHQNYLTRLRSRLVHELRTPVMIVRSSLDNLALETDPGGAGGSEPVAPAARYAQRALDGAARLEQILSAMSAASSLESLLEARDLVPVDLVALGRGCVEGYGLAYPGLRWRLAAVAEAPCLAIPDAVAQALDKLADNAADFATPGSEVVLVIEPLGGIRVDPGWRLVMDNDGPPLPAGRAGDLFESLVSVRPDADTAAGRRAGASHLGLGLHLVHLIAAFHGGTVIALDRPGGVRIGFTLPAD